MTLRHLVLVLGDQLDGASAAFDGFDPAQDAVLMIEAREEASYIPQHRRRLVFFFSAMRHFRDEQRAAGRRVHYSALEEAGNRGGFGPEILRWAETLRPRGLVVLEPGDWRVRQALRDLPLPLEIRVDRHFLCPADAFEGFVAEHPRMVLEDFYRGMRRRLRVLLEPDGSPVGGAWNFDGENRASFGADPPFIPLPRRVPPDATTREVIAMVERRFPDSPGRLDDFDMPVSRADALVALRDFVGNRLELFGRYQDAMRGGEPFLFHSRLSGLMNLHLLNPREVLRAVLRHPGPVPLPAVEGFVRQVIGWREYVRGIYWHLMPDYAGLNALEADLPMPRFYWTGETEMRCLHEAIGHTIDHAYAHHIERLMVLGLFALLLGVRPYDVHRWHMSMFWDAIDWVSLPNALGLGQHGDDGITGTKPYVASGHYIDRMSDHCRRCRYNPRQAVGETACPFTTLYWDFLDRHRPRFGHNARMRQQYRGLDAKDRGEMAAIRRQAATLRARLTADEFL